jgi:hypothetical protein
MEKSWLNGLASAVRYNPAKGATRYLPKSVRPGKCEIEFSDKLGRLMQNCTESEEGIGGSKSLGI